MNVTAKRAILFYIEKYPSAKTALLVWLTEMAKADFKNLNELKKMYGNAGIVSFNFKQSAAYIIWFGTHKEYNGVDVETISFDRSILID